MGKDFTKVMGLIVTMVFVLLLSVQSTQAESFLDIARGTGVKISQIDGAKI